MGRFDEGADSAFLKGTQHGYMVADIQKWHFGAIHFGLVSRILQWYYMCNGNNTTSVLYTTPTVGG